MSALVSYSDSDSSESELNHSNVTSLPLPCPFAIHPDAVDCDNLPVSRGSGTPTSDDFFDLKRADDNSNFWKTTGLDNELLPTSEVVQNAIVNRAHKSPNANGDSKARNRVSHVTSPTLTTSNEDSKLSVVYQIPCEYYSQSGRDLAAPIFYPRLGLAWPVLAACVPPSASLSTNLYLYRLSHSDLVSGSWSHEPLPLSMSSLRPRAAVCCVQLLGTPVTTPSLQLFSGLLNGLVYVWDMAQGRVVNQVDASKLCAGRLRCIAAGSAPHVSGVPSPMLLTAGYNGQIGLWDLRVSGSVRPQQTLCHAGQAYSTSDLLWLTDTQFASTSDTVDRNKCDPNLCVWDTRFNRPISHQLYQERWGCSRLTARSSSSGPLGFAAQTHGNAIVEVWGTHKLAQTSSLDKRYRLERRWRYEGHECQAHPLGLSYSTDNAFLASGCWGSTDPVIWHARRTKFRQPGVLFHRRNDAVRFEETDAMLTDVTWIPRHLTATTYAELIGVRHGGTIVIYRMHTDDEQ